MGARKGNTAARTRAKAILKRNPAKGAKVSESGDIEWLGEMFDQRQWEAITSDPERSTLVLGCGGTGKTRVLVARYVWLVKQHGVDPESILLLTHMNAAANDMFERVNSELDGPHVGSRRNRRRGGTINSWCCWLLRKWGNKVGVSQRFGLAETESMLADICGALDLHTEVRNRIKDVAHEWNVARLWLGDARAKLKKSIRRLHKEWCAHAEKRKNARVPARKLMNEQIFSLIEEYEKRKQASNLLDFADQIVKADELIRRPDMTQRLQKMYSHVLLDEFQDNTRRQSKLIERFMKKRGGVFAVCGPCQSILKFAGATISNTTKFTAHFGVSWTHVLENNYRCSQLILDSLRDLATQVKDIPAREAYLAGFKSRVRTGRRPWLLTAPGAEEGERWIAERIKMLRRRGVDARRIAVVARSWSHLDGIEARLMDASIPVTGSRTKKSKESDRSREDLLALLRLAANPEDRESLMRVVRLARGVGPSMALTLADSVAGSPDILVAAMRELKTRENAAAKRMLKILRKVKKVRYRSTAPVKAIRIAWNCYCNCVSEDVSSGICDQFEQMLEFAREQPSLLTLLDDVYSGGRPRDDGKDAVTLAVPHTAKGRQWDYVFVARVCEGGFPNLHSTVDVEEELFNLFVAMSRARKRLYLVYPRTVPFSRLRHRHVELSRYLKPIEHMFDAHEAATSLRKMAAKRARLDAADAKHSTERLGEAAWRRVKPFDDWLAV